MLSMSKSLSVGQASTYYEKDNYYTSSTGEWQGKGAEALGLSGEIDHKDFSNIVKGNNTDGTQIIAPPQDKRLEHRAGIDLSFSAGKSVSITSMGCSYF